MHNFIFAASDKKLLVGLLFISLVGLGFTPSSAGRAKPITQSMPGHLVILRHDDQYNPYQVPAPQQAELGIQAATIVVNYNPAGCSGTITPWPAQAQAAFDFAINIWESLLISNQTMVVDACWRSDLGFGVLGSAGPTNYYRDFPDAPLANSWYPVAVANSLASSDLNSSQPEIVANFSSTFNWYYGTDRNTPAGQVDFVSVVLHEIGHGLGFTGSMIVSASTGSWGLGSGFPFGYDRFSEDNGGTQLLNTIVYPNFSGALKNVLTSNAVFFDGPVANAANGGNRVELYAPTIWSQGSSYSHLAESFNNTPNALMTFSLANGEAVHNPGSVTLGIFQDLGWKVVSGPDLSIVKQLLGGNHQPGDPVAFTLTFENLGTAAATNVVVTDILATEILSPSYASSVPGLSVQNGTYAWSVPDLAPAAAGLITVTGTLDPSLPPDFVIVNNATIDTAEAETVMTNNNSSAIVGGARTYLPMILR